ncbi:MAG: FAD-dependent monooxygenase [Roseobacter sp.]
MPQDALVIGGGIGGLAVALALAQRGVAVTVAEQAAQIAEVGAGIQISPNGAAVLKALGVLGAVAATGAVAAGKVRLRDYAAGAEVAKIDLTHRADQRFLFVHRADLVRVLLEAVVHAGVDVQLGCRAAKFEPNVPNRVDFETGERLSTELVVFADGLHSVGRFAINGVSDAQFTGQVAWRALVPAQNPISEVSVYMGPGRHMVCYPLRGGQLMNVVAVEERETWAQEGWHHRDDPENLRRAFATFGGQARHLLDKVEEVHLWGLFRHPVAENWFSGSSVLLGDAAHPTLPFLAQGANMALEDAWALAHSVCVGGGLKAYQNKRRARTKRIVATATGNARKYHLRHGPLRWAAHRALSIGSRLAPGLMVGQFDWLYRYDVTSEV